MKKRYLLFLLIAININIVAQNVTVTKGDLVFTLHEYVNVTTCDASVAAANTEIAGDIVIPDKIEIDGKEYEVQSIDEFGFKDCSKITSITLPQLLRSIEYGAFMNCSGLTELHIPRWCTGLAWCIFTGCDNLKTFTVEEHNQGVQVIGPALFTGGGETLDAFARGQQLEYYEIPEGVTVVVPYVFEGDLHLKTVKLPSSMTTLASEVFKDCSALKELTIPRTVQHVYNAFRGCSSMESLTIRNIIPPICDCFDDEFYSNVTLYIPNGSKEAYMQTEYWNKFEHVEEVEMEDAQQDIFNYQILSDTEVSISVATKNVPGVLKIPETVEIDGKTYTVTTVEGFNGCERLKSVELPNTITTICSQAFDECTQLETIHLSASVKTLDQGVFRKCNALRDIIVDENNPYLKVVDGLLMSADGTEVYAYAPSYSENVNIPNGVKIIQLGCFDYNEKVKSIHLPKSVVNIGTFSACLFLEKINIPASIELVQTHTFDRCISLQEIYYEAAYPADVNYWGPFDYDDIPDIYSTVTLYVPKGRSTYFRNAPIWGNFKNIKEKEMDGIEIPQSLFLNIDDNRMKIGYYPPFNRYEIPRLTQNLGYQGAGKCGAGIEFESTQMKPYTGKKLTAVRIALQIENISDLKVNLSHGRNEEPFYSQDLKDVQIGWNEVLLNTPYEIDGQHLFIYFTYIQDEACYPLYLYTTNGESGSCLVFDPDYYKADGTQGAWLEQEGCLMLQGLIEGDKLPEYDIHAVKIEMYSPFFEANSYDESMVFHFRNWGKKSVDDFEVVASIDDVEYYTGTPAGLHSVPGLYYGTIRIGTLPINTTNGKHIIKAGIKTIKGKTPAFSEDDFITVPIYVIDKDMGRRKELLEHFSATWCPGSMSSGKAINTFINDVGKNRLSIVCIHNNDEYSSPSVQAYGEYWGVGVIPHIVFDRVSDFPRSFEFTPALADVQISARLAPKSRQLAFTVNGIRIDDYENIVSNATLTVLLVEDEVKGKQFDVKNGEYVDYVHQGVMRTCLSEIQGDAIAWKDNKFAMDYQVKLDPLWNVENLRIVAFICNPEDRKQNDMGVVNCNDFTVKDAEIVSIDPVQEDEEKSFKDELKEDTDLSDKVINNTYYNMDEENGDGYDAEKEALVLNSTTSAEQMNTIQGANVGDISIRNNFNGIIFELAPGRGTVTVDVQTIGTHVLMVQIGNNAPTKVTKSERGTVEVPYNVKEPTYVYLYASTADGSAAPIDRAPSAGDNSVLLYGYKLTIKDDSIIPGDVNGDGLVNVTDIVATVNFIMEKPSNNFNELAADLNGDGKVNVTDIVKMVTIIMSGDGASSRRAAATSSNLVISGNNIQLKNAEDYIAAQFDINLGDGESISNVVLNGSSNHSLYWKMINENTYRVVVYSITNAAFHVNSDDLFEIFMTSGQDATISNEILIRAENTTGIDAIRKETENGIVYDLNGRQVKNPRKGVYIINGKKVLVK